MAIAPLHLTSLMFVQKRGIHYEPVQNRGSCTRSLSSSMWWYLYAGFLQIVVDRWIHAHAPLFSYYDDPISSQKINLLRARHWSPISGDSPPASFRYQERTEANVCRDGAMHDQLWPPCYLPPWGLLRKHSIENLATKNALWKNLETCCCTNSHFKIMRDALMSKLWGTCSCFCCLVKITRDAGSPLQIGTSSYF